MMRDAKLTQPDERGCPLCKGRGYWLVVVDGAKLYAACLSCEGRGTSAAEEARLAEWERVLGP